jgi:hypothetical protein
VQRSDGHPFRGRPQARRSIVEPQPSTLGCRRAGRSEALAAS